VTDLFPEESWEPLAARLRPLSLDDFAGQEHILGAGKPLRAAIESGSVHSMVFWGPPGIGKTTLAKIIAEKSSAHFESISAVMSGVKEIRAAIEIAESLKRGQARKTILFVDEVHRFSKSQQDAFLPFIENGTILFIGATTENPSFELNSALLSRVRVYVLRPLAESALLALLQHALSDVRGLKAKNLQVSDFALAQIAGAADGDARRALNLLEIASDLAELSDGCYCVADESVKEVVQGRHRRFDKGGDVFYDQISALHKSVRGSDPDAALYWFARMIDGGCDALYIARRVVRMASEDIGNADPKALQIALNAWDVQERLGSPEGELSIAQAIVYLAVTAKSNATYSAYNAALACAREHGSLEVPPHLRNAPTRLMSELGHGKGYRYAHDEAEAYAAGECYFPPELRDVSFYAPTDNGLERKISERLEHLKSLDKSSRKKR